MTPQPDLRSQINMLRFLLVAGLVLLHYGSFPSSDLSPFRGLQPSPNYIATFINSFFLFFFLTAVPLLSTISGWLFFKSFDNSLQFYGRRIRARSRSILLPMILWNLIIIFVFFVISFITSNGTVLSIVAYDVTNLTIKDAVNAVFGVTRHPINFQFWFLRDLFLTILLSPLLGIALRVVPLTGAAVLGTSWLLGFDFWIFFRTDVIFFFYLGGLLQVRGAKVDHQAPRLGLVLLASFVALAAARTIGPYYISEDSAAGILLFEYGTRVMRFVGVLALWLVAPAIVATAIGRTMASLGSVAFFLHAIHWPVNQFIKHALAIVLPVEGNAMLLLNYMATAVITVVLAIVVARFLNRLSPQIFDVLSGGRSRAWSLRGATDMSSRTAT